VKTNIIAFRFYASPLIKRGIRVLLYSVMSRSLERHSNGDPLINNTYVKKNILLAFTEFEEVGHNKRDHFKTERAKGVAENSESEVKESCYLLPL
jgi:hypothetical protein